MQRIGRLVWLSGHSSEDIATWRTLWGCTSERRPHWHPSFANALTPRDRESCAVVYQHKNGATVLYPFWVGTLERLPFCPEELRECIDIVSPYGYGGPSYEGPQAERQEVEAPFREAFADECRERRVVSEFVREDIFSDHLVQDAGVRVPRQQNVVVRLGLQEREQLKRYKHKVRKNVRRAREEGLVAEVDTEGGHLEEFMSVYCSTMKRTGAPEYFMFPQGAVEHLTEGLGVGTGVAYVHVWDGDNIVSTELLLLSRHVMYSFLGGTRESALGKRPNDLLKHEAILWGGRNGFEYYVLGGGARPDDGIFRYKSAFDPGSTTPFYTRQRVHDAKAYAALSDARSRVSPPVQEGFFPEYRG